MLCGKLGSGAVTADNEGQTLAGFGAAAVGGPCLEANAAGGSAERGRRRRRKEGVEEEGNKGPRLNVVDTFFIKKS